MSLRLKSDPEPSQAERSQTKPTQTRDKGKDWRLGEEAQRKNIDLVLSDSTNKQYSRAWVKFAFCKDAEVNTSFAMTCNC